MIVVYIGGERVESEHHFFPDTTKWLMSILSKLVIGNRYTVTDHPIPGYITLAEHKGPWFQERCFVPLDDGAEEVVEIEEEFELADKMRQKYDTTGHYQ